MSRSEQGNDCDSLLLDVFICSALMDAAKAKGAQVIIGKVEGMESEGRRVTGVVVDGSVIKCDCTVIAMGPWSCMAEGAFFLSGITVS